MIRRTGQMPAGSRGFPDISIMNIRYWSKSLPFIHPFRISRGMKTHQPTLIVELEHRGLRGYGEAPANSYYGIPVEKMVADLESRMKWVSQHALTDPLRFWHFLHHLFPDNSFLVCALDIAAWDLWGKLLRKPLHEIWKLDPSIGPMTDFTIGIDEPERMLEKMKERPWPIYKVKLGTPQDLEIMQVLRKNTDSVLRVDANAGWSASEALEKIPTLQSMDIEFVEQPLARENQEGMRTLREISPIPLIADESCVAESEVDSCQGLFHGINIKLTKCGGISPALRMIGRARELGMKVMVGSMNESSIGSAAIAQMIPLLDFLDMDGPLLLSEDLAQGLVFDYGKVRMPKGPGLGIEVGAL
jgi:L-alanine-DL-glutamate epimerase-like enolase superfamily enzyme